MDETSQHYLKYVVFPAGHESAKNALLRALGDRATLQQVLAMSDDELLKLPVPMFEKLSLLESYKEEVERLKYRRESSPAFQKPFYLCKEGQPLHEAFELTYLEDFARVDNVLNEIEKLRQSMAINLNVSCLDSLVGNVVIRSELLSLNGKNSRERVFYEYAKILVSFALGSILKRYKNLPVPYGTDSHNVNVLPLTDRPFFEDDATTMLHSWIKSIVGKEYITESWNSLNTFLSFDDFSSTAIRNYINDKFFDDHCNTFLGQPIYWRISSGPYRAFECLVYVHNFDEATLPKIRIDYLQPLITKYKKLLEDMPLEQESASSISQKIGLKEEGKLLKLRISEAQKFDDKLKFAADARFKYHSVFGIEDELRRLRKLGLDVK